MPTQKGAKGEEEGEKPDLVVIKYMCQECL